MFIVGAFSGTQTVRRKRPNLWETAMTFIVRVLMEEAGSGNKVVVSSSNVHVDGQFEFDNLEKAREAAQIACHAAANLKPRRYKEVDDDDWKFHPDRSDD